MMCDGCRTAARRVGATGGAGLVALLFTLSGMATPAHAQRTVAIQGIATVEGWSTDSGSTLLTRNHGRPGLVGRLNVWGAAELGSRLVVYAAGTVEGGSARHEEGTEWYTDMAGVRFTASDALVIDAGKMVHPVGAFASRRYPDRNPLVGAPDSYPLQYPWGVQLSGVRGTVDYRAAIVSLPITDDRYLPATTAHARPAVRVGITPAVGVRVGLSSTWGPYLNCDLPASQLAGRPWHAYEQRIGAVEAQVSRGYLELRGELGVSRYEVPGASDAPPATVDGFAWYGDAKYTVTPRLFVATRVERNDYAFIQPLADGSWIASPTNMYNAELGAGYRFGARTLFKASVRADQWKVSPELRPILPDGVAFAVQLSRRFEGFGVDLGG